MLDRHSRQREKERSGVRPANIPGYFDLMPILLSGSMDSAVPDEFSSLLCGTLETLHVRKTTAGELQDVSRNPRHIALLDQVAAKLLALPAIKNPEIYDKYALFEHLFVDLKADARTKKEVPLERVFVKTRAYQLLQHQGGLFLVGRKGTGKSTISRQLSDMNSESLRGHIRIIADRFDLQEVYSLYGAQFQEETKTVFDRLKCFQFAWECFLVICFMDLLYELEDSRQLLPLERAKTPRIRDFLAREFPVVRHGLDVEKRSIKAFSNFAYAFNNVRLFLSHCIAQARPEEARFMSDLSSLFQPRHFLEFVFGTHTLEAFEELCASFQHAVLVTLDGFDSSFDRFRRQTLSMQSGQDERFEFEIDWLRGLMQVMLLTREHVTPRSPLYDTILCCATLPKDRFMEVTKTERDSYRYRPRSTTLDWTGVELAILIRKRLELIGASKVQPRKSLKQLPPLEYFRVVHESVLPRVPWEISFDFHDRHYRDVPLFIYLLRHTCWRPREILLFYARLITAADIMPGKEPLTDETVRRIVKEQVISNITDEFVNEFGSIVNIEGIIEQFAEGHQRLSYLDLRRTLDPFDFRFVVGNLETENINDKIRFLYEIGFLGIVASEANVKRWDLGSRYAFYFNEGDAWLSSLREGELKAATFIIHPMFVEYLMLKTDGKELTCSDWTLDYLITNERSRI